MHDDEVAIDDVVVRALLRSQHPRWGDLPLVRVPSAGTDNAMFRLGDDLAVRLPRVERSVALLEKELEWLPRLAPAVPLAVPRPVALGEPDESFPFPWAVVEWLPGELATDDEVADPAQLARDLAGFVVALRAIDATGGPHHERGDPVRRADAMVRTGVAGLRGEVDADALTAAWERCLDAPDHNGRPVWFHGDLGDLNLLARDGRLSAVIDWGTCGVGDPAIECRVAWNLFGPEERRIYRELLDVDDATWERGKGWILTGVYGIPYYRDTNPTLVAQLLRGIDAVLSDPIS